MDTFLSRLSPGSELDARGTRFAEDLLDRLLQRVQDDDGRPLFAGARFTGARFEQTASFAKARFGGPASFSRAWFRAEADFTDAEFGGDGWFESARFDGDATFSSARFLADAMFYRAWFEAAASFVSVRVREYGSFQHVRFRGDTRFALARFGDRAMFAGARFEGNVSFDSARFVEAFFRSVHFASARRFGPILAVQGVVLDHAGFDQRVLLAAATPRLSCTGTRFESGGNVRLRFADVALDDAEFATTSSVSFAAPFTTTIDIPGKEPTERVVFDESVFERSSIEPKPRLISVRGTDLANLTFTDLDLSQCLFEGASHIEAVRIEGPASFGGPPRGWRLRLGNREITVWPYARRQTTIEERAWRAGRHHGQRGEPRQTEAKPRRLLLKPAWAPLDLKMALWLLGRTGHGVETLTAERLASTYRSIRKSYEGASNEPGGADFYYGEMEMRRFASATPWGEKVILYLYWLLSGYGLRGLRSLAWLLGVLLVLAVLFQHAGFIGPYPSFVGSLIFTAQSAISIETKAMPLSQIGDVLRIVLRLAGPLLLGLALLSVRNRVKR